jgi:hypothetical protein
MPSPQHKRLVNALKKAGATIWSNEDRPRTFYAKKGNEQIEWHIQEGYPDKEKMVAVCIVKRNPMTDIMTDCFCDWFAHSIKEAVTMLN